MRHLILCIVILAAIFLCSAETVLIDNSKTSVEVLSSNDKGIRLEFRFGSFDATPILINGKTYHQLKIKGEPVTYVETEPELPFLARSVMIPERSGVKVSLVESDSREYDYKPVPSKGLLLRKVDPKTVPYSFSDTYSNKTSYPLSDLETGEPYIMREVRGMVIKAYPFVYDAMKQTVRVRHRMVVDITFEGINETNALSSRPTAYCSDFEPLYSNHFLNFDRDRYTSLSETGKLLVISHPDFMSAALEYVNWKQKKGITTTLISTTVAGSTPTEIKSTINSYYANGYAFFQLVGDAAQVPTFDWLGGGADPMYTLLSGSDNYPDAFIGRFSAETLDEVYTQVNKTIYYERDLGSSAWLPLGTGIASNEGDEVGDEGEADDEHMGNLRTLLLGYNYTAIDEFYQATGATGTMVTNALNSGRGIVNYIGHGSTNSWSTTGYSNTNVNNLTNDYKLPFIHSVACVNGNFVDNTCFAEAWLRAKNNTNGSPTGAVAFYGSSINQAWAPPMEAQDEYVDLLIAESKKTLGGLWYNGSCSMIDQYGDQEVGASMFKTWNIFGDASLVVRTANPTAITATHSSTVNSGATSFFVDTNTAGATVTLWKNGVIYGNGVANASGDITLSLSPALTQSGTYYVTATHFNKITYSGTAIMYDANQRTWTGAVSNVWHNSANWYNNQMPTNTTDAFIPTGLTRYPVITTDYGMCRDLIIEYSAKVTINTNILYVYRNAYISGELIMNHSSSYLLVYDVYWYSGATADITNNSANFTCNGNMIFEPNSNVVITMGNINFTDIGDSYIINKSSNTQINNLVNNKTNPAFLAFSSESTQPITINGNIVNLEGKTMYNYYTGNIILKGNLTSENTGGSGGIMWYYGTLVMDGADQNISFANTSSYINNLTASQSGTLTYTNALTVKGILAVENGSSITVGASHLTVEGDANFWGQLNMNHSAGNLYVLGSINWETGSTANITNASADIYCQGNMHFSSNSNVLMTMGYVEFYGSGESAIINKKSTTQIFNLRSNKTAPGYLYISASSTANFTIAGSIWNYQNRIFHNYYTGNTILKGNLTNYNTNTNGFTWETGTLVLNSFNHSISLANANDCVNNLTLNHTGSVTTSYDLKIKGNLSLNNGTFSPGAYLVYVGGNWTKNTSAVYTNTNSTIIFNGSSTQTISSTAFNVLRMNKSGGNLKINTGSTVTAASYKYDLGTIEVAGGTFTVIDLADNNIKGSYILSSGTINLTQDNTFFVDLDADLNISGGVFNINGGFNFPADWAYTRNINITMSGGVLDWGTRSIGITNTGYAVTFNLTGGTIRTQGSVSIDRPNFQFTDGTFEMYGTTDATLSTVSSASFYDLKINKAASRNERDNPLRANTVTLGSNIYVFGDINITSGSLKLNNNTLTTESNMNISGGLIMTEEDDNLTVYGHLYWNQGAVATVTWGSINLYGNIYIAANANLLFSEENRITFKGIGQNGIYNQSSNCTFSAIEVGKDSGSVSTFDSQPLTIQNLTVNSPCTMYVSSTVTVIYGIGIFPGAAFYISGYLTTNYIDISGYLEMNGSSLTCHGNFFLYGQMVMNNSSCILDKPFGTAGIVYPFYGALTLNNSTIEISNHGMLWGPAASIVSNEGGLIKVGWNFVATNLNTFQPTNGNIEFIGARNALIQCNNGNYFHNLLINKPSGYTVTTDAGININKDLFVVSGTFSPGAGTTTLIYEDLNVLADGVLNAAGAELKFVGYEPSVITAIPAITISTLTVYKQPGSMVDLNADLTLSGTTQMSIPRGFFRINDNTMILNGSISVSQLAKLWLSEGSVLDLADGSSITVSGLSTFKGFLEAMGSAANPAKITSSDGYYALNLNAGSVMKANYCIFEKMNSSGIHFYPGSALNTEYPMSNCTFQYGQNRGALIWYENDAAIDYVIPNANFPVVLGINYKNVKKTTSVGSLTFLNVTGPHAGPTYEIDDYNTVHWIPAIVPNPPLNLTITTNGTVVSLNWSAVAGVTGYKIYRAFSPTEMGSAVLVGTTASTSWTDTGSVSLPNAFYFVKSYVE